MKVTVQPPDPRWASGFAEEAGRIGAALADLQPRLHHIGSTSIHGIWAKPVIDMMLLVPRLDTLDPAAGRLQALGYEAMGEYGMPGRRYFRKHAPDGTRTHHLHAFEARSGHALRHVAFRDYMNAHPEAAQAYSALKQRLAAAFPDDIEAYMDGKDAFIKEFEMKAIKWLAFE